MDPWHLLRGDPVPEPQPELGHDQALLSSFWGAKRVLQFLLGFGVSYPASHRGWLGMCTEGEEEIPTPRSHSSDLGGDAALEPFKIKRQGGEFAQNKIHEGKSITGWKCLVC